MNKQLLMFFCSVFMVCGSAGLGAASSDKEFVVIIPSYKNMQWFKKNLDSIMMQEKTYTKWRMIYIDDKSPDGTGAAVAAYVKERGFEHKITVIQNEVRVGALANIYNAVLSCDNSAVVCTVDGDDWIIVDNLFCILNDLYADPNVWMTYGQYQEYPVIRTGQCLPMPRWVIEQQAFRKIPWITSHLRTFYVKLFKKILPEDLMFNGKFFSTAWDLSFMFPMLEMAGEHIRFNPIIVYEYNMDNPLNDFKQDRDLQVRIEMYIRNKPRYDRLKNLFE